MCHSGNLSLTYWGTQEHYSTQVEVEWGFGSLLGERDLMLHMMANYPLHWMAQSGNPYLTAEEASKLYAEAMVPYNDDRYLVDYGEGPTGVYSDSKVKQVAWVKHYEKFWIGAGGFCGWRWPHVHHQQHRRPERRNTPGRTQILECRDREESHVCRLHGNWATRFTLLTGPSGYLQGRHRDMEVFPDYVYDKPAKRRKRTAYGHRRPVEI